MLLILPSTASGFADGCGSTKCLEMAIGLPTSATSMNPHTSIVSDTFRFIDSKSVALLKG